MDPIATPPSFVTQALRDLDAWVRHFRDAEIPVLGSTADALEAMRANEDDVDANLIGEMVADDPLMTLKVLAYASTHRPPRLITDVETVTAAVVMMGISPFFGNFGRQPAIEDWLGDQPEALEGVGEVLRRAHRAAQFALSFAVHRMDHDAAVIYEATLLHDFAEMLLWCHAPTLALKMRSAQKADPTLRSHAVQQQVLNIQLFDLQQALMRAWALPELLIRITDDRHARHPSVQNVMLAVRLARHSAESWDNPAIPDDITALAQLLNLSEPATLQFVRDIES
ncbi:HDOD domain-containing protein [Piscinibacter gummiphilus]|uniref:HDOD domain-containing protein n=1 Tax=Piscinibacter gummiphilus TaxID=946333 RepID=A0ABZ0D0J1_9BURK|nr:HDOD domain-containing protein [Piscinibacter gummiphilus]WOB08966.1 HDOD domain-containing protein [Piscinibacter gummiphilus]